jgi:hypothetical protein
LPSLHGIREFVVAGGLISYGPNLADLFRHAAYYVDKILRGAKRMRESRTYESVRGARGNSRPYREDPRTARVVCCSA